MSTQEQRERFEEWASEQQGYFSRQAAWAAWQAAEAAAIERCAKLCDDELYAERAAERIRALLAEIDRAGAKGGSENG